MSGSPPLSVSSSTASTRALAPQSPAPSQLLNPHGPVRTASDLSYTPSNLSQQYDNTQEEEDTTEALNESNEHRMSNMNSPPLPPLPPIVRQSSSPSASSNREYLRKRSATLPERPRALAPGQAADGPSAPQESLPPMSPTPPTPPAPPTPTAAAITSPPGDLRPPPGVRRATSGSDIILPRWQPDSDVTECPVCGTGFSWLFRKHHCRKCGRVVCANCSPHRITIPRRFIVRPPSREASVINPTMANALGLPTASPAQDANRPALPSRPSFSGYEDGEEVRVCNPCVPDPNLSPPPYSPPEYSPLPPSGSRQAYGHNPRHSLPGRGPPLPPAPREGVPFPGFYYPARSSSVNQRTSMPPDIRARLMAGLPDPLAPSHPFAGTNAPFAQPYGPGHAGGPVAFPGQSHNVVSPIPPPPRFSSQQQPRVTGGLFPPYRLSSGPSSRVQVAEEDECPVCGEELPPRGPDGNERDREAHVEECIRERLGGGSSAPNLVQPVPAAVTPATAGEGTATPPAPSASAPPGNIAAASPPSVATPATRNIPIAGSASAAAAHQVSNTPPTIASASATASSSLPSPRGRRATGTRMLVYRATEKDCLDESGLQPQECVICFEEFAEGQELGRLECLCKFHRSCIRAWWEARAEAAAQAAGAGIPFHSVVGRCPTHVLHS